MTSRAEQATRDYFATHNDRIKIGRILSSASASVELLSQHLDRENVADVSSHVLLRTTVATLTHLSNLAFESIDAPASVPGGAEEDASR